MGLNQWRLNELALGNPAFTGSAGVFGPPGDDHPELGGDDVQPFADIFANDMARGSATTGQLGFDGHFHPFQMLGQRLSDVSALGTV